MTSASASRYLCVSTIFRRSTSSPCPLEGEADRPRQRFVRQRGGRRGAESRRTDGPRRLVRSPAAPHNRGETGHTAWWVFRYCVYDHIRLWREKPKCANRLRIFNVISSDSQIFTLHMGTFFFFSAVNPPSTCWSLSPCYHWGLPHSSGQMCSPSTHSS